YGNIGTGALQTQTACAAIEFDNSDCHFIGGSVSALHFATGLFVNFGAGHKKDDLIASTALYSRAVTPYDEENFWSIQAGIERKWTPLGKTTLYGEYYDYSGGSNTRTIEAAFAGVGAAGNAAVLSTGVQSWGLGVAQ